MLFDRKKTVTEELEDDLGIKLVNDLHLRGVSDEHLKKDAHVFVLQAELLLEVQLFSYDLIERPQAKDGLPGLFTHNGF